MCVRTIQRLNYGGQESKKRSAVYDSDTPMTLKEGQGNQPWYELVGPKQDYLHSAKSEKLHLNSVCEKPMIKCVKSGYT